MKNKIITFVCATIFASGIIGLVNYSYAGGGIGGFFSSGNVSDEIAHVVRVNGMGKVEIKPDTAIVNIGVETRGKTSKEAQTENKAMTNKIMEVLTKLEIAREDIKTQYYNINADYDYQSKERELVGYHASHQLNIKIRDLTKVADIIDQAAESGISNIGNAQYIVENKSEAYDKARKIAANNAKEKAQKLATVFDVEIGKVVQIEEYINDYNMPYPMAMEGRGGGDSLVEPKGVEVHLSLNVAFAIED